MELDRRDATIKDLEVSKRSLQQEVNSLKAIIDENDDEDDDEEETVDENESLSGARLRELAAQKEIIIARDQVNERIKDTKCESPGLARLRPVEGHFKVVFFLTLSLLHATAEMSETRVDFFAAHTMQKDTFDVLFSLWQEIEKLSTELESSGRELRELRADLDRHRETFETEKGHWLEEKEKVIRYQKQLQLNYVQMYKRNKTLEAELEEARKARAAAEAEAAKAAARAVEAAAATSKPKKSSGGMRAKLFKMTLHSESQC